MSSHPFPPSPLYIASDHAGVELKGALQKLFPSLPKNYTWKDLGPADTASVDYPDFASKLCNEILEHTSAHTTPLGVLICGSGIGMSIAANRHPGIRAALVGTTEMARLSREHNGANVLCLGARFLTPETAKEILSVWLTTPFAGGRHQTRIDKLDQ